MKTRGPSDISRSGLQSRCITKVCKKQAAQAAIEAEAEREFQARYDDQQHWMLAGMSEYYGSEGFDRPPSGVYSYGGG